MVERMSARKVTERHQQLTLLAAGRINDSVQSRERMMPGPSSSNCTHYSQFFFTSISITFLSPHSCTHECALYDIGLWNPPLSTSSYLKKSRTTHSTNPPSLLVPFHYAYMSHLELKYGIEGRRKGNDWERDPRAVSWARVGNRI